MNYTLFFYFLMQISGRDMAQINCTQVKEFILVGLTDQEELKTPLFVLFLSIYLFTVAGNLGLILVIRTDSRLHTPMYFFLSNLAFVDFCYSSAVTPKMLGNFLYKKMLSLSMDVLPSWAVSWPS